MGVGSLIWLLWVSSELLEEYQLPQMGLYLLAFDYSLIRECRGLGNTFFSCCGTKLAYPKRYDGTTGILGIIMLFVIALLTRPESPLLIMSFIIALHYVIRLP